MHRKRVRIPTASPTSLAFSTTASNDQPTFLTPKESAAFLRLSTVTLARWRIEGMGPSFRKFGRRVVYARPDLVAWADLQKQQSTSAIRRSQNRGG